MDSRQGMARTWSDLGWLVLRAGLFALAELGLALLIGGFFAWGRAEALLFLAFRPLLLLIVAFSVVRLPWSSRYLTYALCLIVAGLAEALFLLALGALDPWPEMVRGWIGGILLVFLADTVLQAGRRLAGRRGSIAALLVAFAILMVPGALDPYERIVLGSTESRTGPLPEVVVMTSLPIIWGETGPFDPTSRPSESWKALQQAFELRPIDRIRPDDLAGSRLLLLAQPRQLSPAELVTVDRWIRRGGRALLLADPLLAWPSELPPGDARRPFTTNMLLPLLSHWGIHVAPSGGTEMFLYRLRSGGEIRQLRMMGRATLTSRGDQCRNEAPFMLDCRIGNGRAIVVADSDLLHDSTIAPMGIADIDRHRRISDNAVVISDWLDSLADLDRSRPPVQWAQPDSEAIVSVVTGLLPIAAFLVLAILLIVLGGRHSQTYPQTCPPQLNGQPGKNKPRKGRGILW